MHLMRCFVRYTTLGAAQKVLKVNKIALGTCHTGFRARLLIGEMAFDTAPRLASRAGQVWGRLQEAPRVCRAENQISFYPADNGANLRN